MSEKRDEEEKRTDREQSEFYSDLGQKPQKTSAEGVPKSTKDLSYPPIWQEWGFPAGLTIGILIGLVVGYLLTFRFLL